MKEKEDSLSIIIGSCLMIAAIPLRLVLGAVVLRWAGFPGATWFTVFVLGGVLSWTRGYNKPADSKQKTMLGLGVEHVMTPLAHFGLSAAILWLCGWPNVVQMLTESM